MAQNSGSFTFMLLYHRCIHQDLLQLMKDSVFYISLQELTPTHKVIALVTEGQINILVNASINLTTEICQAFGLKVKLALGTKLMQKTCLFL